MSGIIKIKFLAECPTDKEIEAWVENWGCFHYPDVIAYKKGSIVAFLIPEINEYISKSYLSEIYSKLNNVWISAWTPEEGLTTFNYSDMDGENKLDYSKFVGWKPKEKEIVKAHYFILKNVGFSLEYIRFSLSAIDSSFVKIVDKSYDLDEPEFDDSVWDTKTKESVK
jgi:hypothetical protein